MGEGEEEKEQKDIVSSFLPKGARVHCPVISFAWEGRRGREILPTPLTVNPGSTYLLSFSPMLNDPGK